MATAKLPIPPRRLALRENSRFAEAVDPTLEFFGVCADFGEIKNMELDTITQNQPVIPTGGTAGYFMRVNDAANDITLDNELLVSFDLGYHFVRSMCYIDYQHALRDFAIEGGRNTPSYPIEQSFYLNSSPDFQELVTTSPPPLSAGFRATIDHQHASYGRPGYGINGVRSLQAVGGRQQIPFPRRARDEARIPAGNPTRSDRQNPNRPDSLQSIELDSLITIANEVADRHLASTDYGTSVFNGRGALVDATLRPFNDYFTQVVQFPRGQGRPRNYANVLENSLALPQFVEGENYNLKMVFRVPARPQPVTTPSNGNGVFNEKLYYPYFSFAGVNSDPIDRLNLTPQGWMDWRPVFNIYTELGLGEQVQFQRLVENPDGSVEFEDFATFGDPNAFLNPNLLPDTTPTQSPPPPVAPPPPPPPPPDQERDVETPTFVPSDPGNPGSGGNYVPLLPTRPDLPLWVGGRGSVLPNAPPPPPNPAIDDNGFYIDQGAQNQFFESAQNQRYSDAADAWIQANQNFYSVFLGNSNGDVGLARELIIDHLVRTERNPLNPGSVVGETIFNLPVIGSGAAGLFNFQSSTIRTLNKFFGIGDGGGNSGDDGGSAGGQSDATRGAGGAGGASGASTGEAGVSGEAGATGQTSHQQSVTRHAATWDAWQLIDAAVTSITSDVGYSSATGTLDGTYVLEFNYNASSGAITLTTGQYNAEESLVSRNWYDALNPDDPHHLRVTPLNLNLRAGAVFGIKFGNMSLIHIDALAGSEDNKGVR